MKQSKLVTARSIMKKGINLISIVAVAALIFALAACSSSQKKAEQPSEPTGSLIRTYTLVDEAGRNSGTLKVDPFGSVELYDADGKLIKKHTNVPPPGIQPAGVPAETQPTVDPEKAQTTEPTKQ